MSSLSSLSEISVRNERVIVTILFSLFLLVGVFIFRDYGLSWDETEIRRFGYINFEYIIRFLNLDILPPQVPDMQPLEGMQQEERFYGVGISILCTIVEHLVGITDSRTTYLFRHFVTFVIFLIGLVAFYSLVRRRYGMSYAVIGVISLYLSPRIFADQFYNNKDIIFLSFILIATNSLIKFVINPNTKYAIYHAVATAFALNSRIMGLYVIAVTAIYFLSQYSTIFRGHKSDTLRLDPLVNFLVYLSVTWVVFVFLTPGLWEHPFTGLLSTIEVMSRFPWYGSILYYGRYVSSQDLPSHYIFGWMLVTVPPLFLVGFLLGIVSLFSISKSRILFWKNSKKMQDSIFLVSFFLPILAIIGLRATMYDGWRHVYFTYPFFLILSLRGFRYVLLSFRKSQFVRLVLIAACGIQASSLVMFLVQSHPLQNVYFSSVATIVNVSTSRELRDNFILDYWALANRQAIEWILEHDKREKIKISPLSFMPLARTLPILKEEQRARIEIVIDFLRTDIDDSVWYNDTIKSDYLIDNYRYFSEENKMRSHREKPFSPVHRIIVGGHTILTIYKRIGT